MSSETVEVLQPSEGFVPVNEFADRLRASPSSVAEMAGEVLDRIVARDGELRSFVRVTPETVHSRARDVANLSSRLPLYGVPIAVKDLIDTADEATEYGSALYHGHRPVRDAAVVRALRRAGALIVGKTVTTEFALFNPPPTVNPHDFARTPGGSSSGSAAAVAAGLVPVAVGTQTAGSVLRPASYCGVLGFKPGFNVLDREGVRPLAPSFDTVGLFARTVQDLHTVFDALRPRTGTSSAGVGRPRLLLGPGGPWDVLEPSCRTVLRGVGERLSKAGFDVVESGLDVWLADIAEEQRLLMGYEAHRSLGALLKLDSGALSPVLQNYLEEAGSIPRDRALDAMVRISRWQSEWETRLKGVDGVLIPSALGEAPPAASTGDPVLCRAATALGVPAISLPVGRGAAGLPVGVQLIGRRGEDRRLLELAGSIMAEFELVGIAA